VTAYPAGIPASRRALRLDGLGGLGQPAKIGGLSHPSTDRRIAPPDRAVFDSSGLVSKFLCPAQ
jgi:hypothetical protein